MTKPLDGMNLPDKIGERVIDQPIPLNSTIEVNGKPFHIEGINKE